MNATLDTQPRDTASTIARSAWMIAGLSFLALLLNLIWNLVLADVYGASGQLDAFWVAVAFPKAITDSFHFGLLAVIFIGIFGLSDSWLNSDKRWRLASSVLNVVVLFTIAIVVLLFAAAPAMIRAMGPGLAPAGGAIATQMLRTLSLVLLLTVLTGALTGILNAHQKFLPFALVRVVGLAIQVLLLLSVSRSHGIHAAVWAIVAGALAMLAVAIAFVRRAGLKYTPWIEFRGAEAASVRHLFASLGALGLLVFLNQASDRFFASFMGEGSISALEFAWRFEIPITQIASFPVALPAFALFALYMSSGQMDRFRETVTVSAQMIALLVLPMVAFVVILRLPLTALWLERGSFDGETTSLVASLMPLLAVVFVCRALAGILVFGLICTRHARILVVAIVAEVLVNTVLNAVLGGRLGVHGIVLATALAMLASNAFLWTVFVRSLGEFSLRPALARAGRILLVNVLAAAALFMLFVVLASGSIGAAYSPILIGVCGICFVAVYLGACRYVGLIEFRGGKRFFPTPRLVH